MRDVLCFDMNGTGVVNHVWFTMGGGMAAHTVLSFYVDDEIVPSIAFTPTVGLASDAPEDHTTPWGTEVSDCPNLLHLLCLCPCCTVQPCTIASLDLGDSQTMCPHRNMVTFVVLKNTLRRCGSVFTHTRTYLASLMND